MCVRERGRKADRQPSKKGSVRPESPDPSSSLISAWHQAAREL